MDQRNEVHWQRVTAGDVQGSNRTRRWTLEPDGTELKFHQEGRRKPEMSIDTIIILMLVMFIIGLVVGVSLAHPKYLK